MNDPEHRHKSNDFEAELQVFCPLYANGPLPQGERFVTRTHISQFDPTIIQNNTNEWMHESIYGLPSLFYPHIRSDHHHVIHSYMNMNPLPQTARWVFVRQTPARPGRCCAFGGQKRFDGSPAESLR